MSENTFKEKKARTQIQGKLNFPSLISSQFILLRSRDRWGLIFAIATTTGIFCTGSVLFEYGPSHIFSRTQGDLVKEIMFVIRLLLLPIATFLIIVGMYVLNDLFDVEVDRANGKKRPIPAGEVSKNQVWIFVSLTNLVGFTIAFFTFNLSSIMVSVSLIAIGIMYSVPKVCLKDRLVIKTLSISVALMLCLVFGSTGIYDRTITISPDELAIPLYAALMVGIMIFITSPLNDLGDIKGDMESGRRTIPIALGKRRTLKLSILLCCSMVILTWLTYCFLPHVLGIFIPLLVSFHAVLTILNLKRMLIYLDNLKLVRRFVQRISMPLHILLQVLLSAGAVLSQIYLN